MKKLLMFLCYLLLFSSCENDEFNYQNSELPTNAERIYTNLKPKIEKMNRYLFAGLNINLQLEAYKDFPLSKKRELWKEKLNEAKQIVTLNQKQIDFIDSVIKDIDNLNFELNSIESTEYTDYLKRKTEELTFDKILALKIFSTISPIDKDGNILNFNYTSNIATDETLNFLGTTQRIVESENCNSGGCFWCSIAYDECTNRCNESSGIGCGFLLLQRCYTLCYNSAMDDEPENPETGME